jgi:hypothetical protein
MQRKFLSWAGVALVGVVLAGLVTMSAATALAAHSAPSAFELTVDGRDTWRMDGNVLLGVDLDWTFKSRAPFCTTGTFLEFGGPGWTTWRFACDDGSGGLTISIARGWNHNPEASTWETTWRVLDGTGSYAGLRGEGSLRIEVLSNEISAGTSVMTWRSTLQGVVERDAVAPTIAFWGATAAKLQRPAGSYALRLGVALRDDVTDNPVSYTLRVTNGGRTLAERSSTTRKEAILMTVRIRPPAGVRTVRLELTGSDPVGNQVSLTRPLKLPRQAP